MTTYLASIKPPGERAFHLAEAARVVAEMAAEAHPNPNRQENP